MSNKNLVGRRADSKVYYQVRGLNYRGDTIVEVMVAAALVMAILGIGYALSRQGLRQTTDDTLRNQAISYGQSQIEFIRNAITNYNSVSNTLLDTYQSGVLAAGFCILNSGQPQSTTTGTTALCSQYTGGSSVGSSPIAIKNTYDGASKVFTTLVQWTPVGTTRDAAAKQQLTLYYKAP